MAVWHGAAVWRLRKAAAARRWMFLSLHAAMTRMVEAFRWRQLSDAAHRVATRRRKGAVLRAWAASAAASGYAAAMVRHGALKLTITLLRFGLTGWRAAAARQARAMAAETARHERRLRLDAAASRVFRVLVRNALHAVAPARDRTSSSARAAALGRLLDRVDQHASLAGWRSYVLVDLRLLARAADAFPALHRRSHLLHWRRVAAAARLRGTCRRALGRLRHQAVARAWASWAALVERVERLRGLAGAVLGRWRLRPINRALRTWHAQAARRTAALSRLRRSLGSWRLGALGRGWRGWSDAAAEGRASSALSTRQSIASATAACRARWALGGGGGGARPRRRAPEPRGARRPSPRQGDEHVARRLRRAPAHRRGGGGGLSAPRLAPPAPRRASGPRWPPRGGGAARPRGDAAPAARVRRAVRTWLAYAEERSRLLDAAGYVGRYGFLRTLTRAFAILRGTTHFGWLRRTSLARWLSVARTYAFALWRDEAARVATALCNARRAIGFLRHLRIGPAWRTWDAATDRHARRERMAARALGHWRHAGFVAAWDRWVRRTRDAVDAVEGRAEASAMRRALRYLAAHRRARQTLHAAIANWRHVRQRAGLVAWGEWGDAARAEAVLLNRGRRHARRRALAAAIDAFVAGALDRQRAAGLDGRADDARARRALGAGGARRRGRPRSGRTRRARSSRCARGRRRRGAPRRGGVSTRASSARRSRSGTRTPRTRATAAARTTARRRRTPPAPAGAPSPRAARTGRVWSSSAAAPSASSATGGRRS